MRIEEGKILGDWRLLRQVGAGSLGDVCIAEHRFTKKKAALKILPPELARDKNFVLRFEEEVLHLSQFDHPSLAKVLNVCFAEGVYFLAMECIVDSKLETCTLNSFLKREKLEEPSIFSIIEQVARALDYIHAAKSPSGHPIAHMNLKPCNILIANSPLPHVEIKVTDFGLPRVVGQSLLLQRSYKALVERFTPSDADKTQKLTLDCGVMNVADARMYDMLVESCCQAFHFLPPEQLRGDMSAPKEGDIWSFGVLVFWALSNGLYPVGHWREFVPKSDGMNWVALLEACLHITPASRPKNLELLLKSCTRKKEELKVQAVQVQTEMSNVAQSAHAPILTHIGIDDLHQCDVRQPEREMYAVREFQPEKQDNRGIEPISTEMVIIPGGVYFRGSTHGCRDETPRHQVRVPSFCMDIHPVTNEQFVRFLDFLGSEKDSHNRDIVRLRDSRIKKSAGRFTIERGYGKHPAVGVTWYGALAYATWLGKRLPTEVEWEVASMGRLESPLYLTGENIEKSQANFFSSDTTPVMSYPPNGYELYDMAGNVYEWCHDWYEYNYYVFSSQEPENPKGPIQGVYRVLRGGCWKSLKEDLRCAKRHRNNPGAANGTYGFRCAQNVE